MIFKIARERNFSDEEVNELIRNPQPIDSLGALSLEQKFDYLMSAIELVFVDQNVFESEIIFCKNIAIKLGSKGHNEYFYRGIEVKTKEFAKSLETTSFAISRILTFLIIVLHCD